MSIATSKIILNFDSVHDIIIMYKYNLRKKSNSDRDLLRLIPQKDKSI